MTGPFGAVSSLLYDAWGLSWGDFNGRRLLEQ